MANAKILVVDDQKNIRLTVAQSLEPLGYEVKKAVNGEDGIKQLEAEEVDLVLLDLKMPGMGGVEFLKRAITLYPNLQVIIISAHGTVDNAVEAMKLGAIDFIQKPFTPDELRETVDRVLNRETVSAKEESEYHTALELARHFTSIRQFDKAMAQVKKAIGLEPNQAEAFNLLGELQEAMGEIQEAQKSYRAANDLDRTYQPAKDNLARITQSTKLRFSW